MISHTTPAPAFATKPLRKLTDHLPVLVFRVYLLVFFAYILTPLAILALATFNESSFPTVTPWLGTTMKWVMDMLTDRELWQALRVSLLIAAGVIVISVPTGLAAALVLTSLHGRARSFFYALMVSPMLTPGVVLGIATLLFWRRVGIGGGITLSILAQSSFIIAFVMLMVVARLQRFDRTMEEAALGLGASRFYVFRRILLPYLRPSLLAAACIAFLQSFENYNTTLFVRGTETPLTIFIAAKVRAGLTPAINALGLTLMIMTILGAILWEVLRKKRSTAS